MEIKKRRQKVGGITFSVRYPWGACYCYRLKIALRKFGLVVGDSPFIGGDDCGFLMARDRAALRKGRQIVRQAPVPSDYNEEVFLMASLRDSGVYQIMQDWKHLDWQADVSRLRRLGVTLKHVRGRDKKATRRLAFTVSRSKNGS